MAAEKTPPVKELLLVISHESVKTFLESQNIIREDIFDSIMNTSPSDGLKVLQCYNKNYVCWRVSQKISHRLKSVDWTHVMGPLRDQGDCRLGWAYVTADLVAGMLYLLKINNELIQYSIQDLVDSSSLFTVPQNNHYCKGSTIMKGLNFVVENGLQKEVDNPFVRCRPKTEVPPRSLSGLGHIHGVETLTLTEALLKLETQPIGASLSIFQPDFSFLDGEIYRGPTSSKSFFDCTRSVSIIGVGYKDGENFFKVKSSWESSIPNRGYLNVSMETMLVSTDSEGKYAIPKAIIDNFCCATVHRGAYD